MELTGGVGLPQIYVRFHPSGGYTMAIAVGETANKHGDLVRGDIVRGGSGPLVVTGEKVQGQRYLWTGVKVNGHSGAEYKLPRGLVKIGHDANHPALLLVRGARAAAPGLDNSTKIVIGQMCDFIDANNLRGAQAMVQAVRALIA